jgi:serine/threonine protein kinase
MMRTFKEVKDGKKTYELKEVLGSGSFGTVHKAWHKTLHIDVAIKIVNIKKLKDNRVYMDLMF